MSNGRTALINAAALAGSSALNFAALFVWTRTLDAHQFGIYALISATALFLNALFFEWLRLVGARTLYDPEAGTGINPGRGNAILATCLGVATFFALACVAIWLSGVRPAGLRPEWLPLIFLFAMSEMALAMINMISRIRLKAWQYFRSVIARATLSILFGFVLASQFRLGALGVIYGVVGAQVVVALLSVALDPMWRTFRLTRARRADVLQVISFGYPLIISSALTYGVNVTDRYLLQALLGTEYVGLYAAPADLLQKTVVFAMLAINLSAYPALVRAYEDRGPEAARAVLEQNFLIQLAMGFPAVVGFIALAPGLAYLLLGPTFVTEGKILLPFVGAAALIRCFIAYHLTMAFQVVGRMKLMVVSPAVVLAVLVPLGIVLTQRYGLVGMAIAMLLAQSASYIVTAALAVRVFRFSLASVDTLKILAAGCVMGACLYPFRLRAGVGETLLLVACGAAIYAVILIALRLESMRPIEHKVLARLRPSHTAAKVRLDDTE